MTSLSQAKLLAKRALFQRLQSSNKRSKLQAGFTLVELLIVVIIVGILSAIALPNFLNQRDRAYLATARSWASSEARKCAASQAATSSADDFTASPDLTAAELGANVTTVTGDCSNLPAAWEATGLGKTYTYTVTDGGAMNATET